MAPNAGNASRQDPRDPSAHRVFAGLRRGSQSCRHPENGSCRPDVDRDGRRPVRPRPASRRAELSPRRAGSLDHSPFGQVRGARRRPGRHAVDRHTRPASFGGFPTAGSSATTPFRPPTRSAACSLIGSGRIWTSSDHGLNLVVPTAPSASSSRVADHRGTPALSCRFTMIPASPRRLAKPADSRRSRDCRTSYGACWRVPMATCGSARRAA